MTQENKSIDNVSTELLNSALLQVGIQINFEILDRILDVVELLEVTGPKTTLKDLLDMKKEWNKV